MTTDTSTDAFMDEVLDRAMAPYIDLVPADVLVFMRDALREELLAHPVSAKLINRLRPRPDMAQSDDIEIPAAARPSSKRDSGGGSGGG